MTEEEVRSYRQHTDRSIREEAYRSLRRVYNSKQSQISLGNIYTTIVKDWSSEIQMRGYGANVMAQRNLSEEMDDQVVDMLLSEVEKAYPIYSRFLRAKAKMLNLVISNQDTVIRSDAENNNINLPSPISQLPTPFSVWDTGAPLGSVDKDFTFEEAYDLHLSVMKDFDADFYEYSKRMIEEERIDVFPRAGKRGGAFASYRK